MNSDRNSIAKEWDLNAPSRCRQIESGLDISHDLVLVPTIIQAVGSVASKTVLDIGCGCGFLANRLSQSARRVVAIDLSKNMIHEAQTRFSGTANLEFYAVAVEDFGMSHVAEFDVCISNMALVTMNDLPGVLAAVACCLKAGGDFVFSIAHPCFWNLYRHDEPDSTYDYWEPHAVKAPFRITLDQAPLPHPTTYFHRPISTYMRGLRDSGLHVMEILEPRPPEEAPIDYQKSFRFPRFVVFITKKQ
jgi:SAM-dependent methyltransferase